MLRFGADPPDMNERRIIDLFFSRLKLLIIMSKAYLSGYPMGKYRKRAVKINAKLVAHEAVYWEGYLMNCGSEYESEKEADLDLMFHQDRLFLQKVRRLAMTARAFAEGNPMDSFKRQAIQDNIDYICETITFSPRLNDVKFLKVA